METFENAGLTFDVTDTGQADAPGERAAVLLHGFPQTREAWCDVTPRLADAGVRALAPSLRGTCPGAAPRENALYRLEHLVCDVLALLDAAGIERVNLVGHDWGGGIAWAFAMTHPDRMRSLTILSTPHPKAMMDARWRSSQGLKSWYMLALQVPAIPEALLTWGLRRQGLRSMDLPAQHEAAYVAWLSRPGAWRTSIAPYRAMRAPRPEGLPGMRTMTVDCPTTYVWGRRDAYLGRYAAEHTRQFVTGDYRFVEVDADHWLPERNPELVADEILARMG